MPVSLNLTPPTPSSSYLSTPEAAVSPCAGCDLAGLHTSAQTPVLLSNIPSLFLATETKLIY